MDILVLEDDPFIQIDMEDMLRGAGHSVVGPFSKLTAALQAARETSLDFAFLDYNLGGDETSAAIADELVEQGVKFVFVTGHSNDFMPERFRDVEILGKPYRTSDVLRLIDKLN